MQCSSASDAKETYVLSTPFLSFKVVVILFIVFDLGGYFLREKKVNALKKCTVPFAMPLP